MIPSLSARREQVPQELDGIVAKALAKHPTRSLRVGGRHARGARRRSRARPRGVTDAGHRAPRAATTCAPTLQVLPRVRHAARARHARRSSSRRRRPQVDVLPLPFTGRSERARRRCSRTCAGRPARTSALLVMGYEGAGRSALLRHAVRAASPATAARSTRSAPIRAGSPRRSIRSARCSPRCCSCRRCRARSSCATRCSAIGLNERDIPGHRPAVRPPDDAARARAAGAPPRDGVVDAARARARRRCTARSTIVCEDIDRFDHPSLEILRRATEVAELALPPIVMTAHDLVRLAVAGRGAAPRGRRARGQGSRRRSSTRLAKAGVRGLPPVQQLFETTRAYPGPRRARRALPARGRQGRGHRRSRCPTSIAARLSMLTQSTRDVLQAAAVLGIEPQLDLLRSMLPSETLEPAMADAERARPARPRSVGRADVHEPARPRHRLRRDAGRRAPLAARERRGRGRGAVARRRAARPPPRSRRPRQGSDRAAAPRRRSRRRAARRRRRRPVLLPRARRGPPGRAARRRRRQRRGPVRRCCRSSSPTSCARAARPRSPAASSPRRATGRARRCWSR